MARLPTETLSSELKTLSPNFGESLKRTLKDIYRGRCIVAPARATPPPSDPPQLSAARITIDIGNPETELLIPELFTPPFPGASPSDVFGSILTSYTNKITRFVHKRDAKQFIVFAGAICSSRMLQWQYNPEAGWAFSYRNHVDSHENLMITGRLEDTTIGNLFVVRTQDRVDLRALIAILQCRRWSAEGFNTLVIATASEYVVRAVSWQLRIWLYYGWRCPTTGGVPDNSDLWEIFLSELDKCYSEGLNVKIWQIPSRMTQKVNRAAWTAIEG
ncbi:uncharacterized protein GGS22DRAFT_174421 [Annulohypoxylon maeteangense]|uniref:uncharacterized protein n=1 Tax=Annulohypoxylon maeteangense TaxID=1927788 RepID=UPI0020072195|nr:uncharacterized protein GGS22DRAFT_174421 [Annulohypoxylon maeteangense]KAI0880643.1 hypothetical protein GGS22DRAFT_174421 [Annulohypoxylon maeteangense]